MIKQLPLYYLSQLNEGHFSLGELDVNTLIPTENDSKQYTIKVFNIKKIEHYYCADVYVRSSIFYTKSKKNEELRFVLPDIPNEVPEYLIETVKNSINEDKEIYYKKKRIEVNIIRGKKLQEKDKSNEKDKPNKGKPKKNIPIRADINYHSDENDGRIIQDKELEVSNKAISLSSVSYELDRLEWKLPNPLRATTIIERPVAYQNSIDISYKNNTEFDRNTFFFYINENALRKELNRYHKGNDRENYDIHDVVYYPALAYYYLNTEDVRRVPTEKEIWCWICWVIKQHAFREGITLMKGRSLSVLLRRIRTRVFDKYSYKEQLKKAATQWWNQDRNGIRYEKGCDTEEKKEIKKKLERKATKGERTTIELVKKIVLRRKRIKDESISELSKVFGISRPVISKVSQMIKENKINKDNYKKKLKLIYPNLIDLDYIIETV